MEIVRRNMNSLIDYGVWTKTFITRWLPAAFPMYGNSNLEFNLKQVCLLSRAYFQWLGLYSLSFDGFVCQRKYLDMTNLKREVGDNKFNSAVSHPYPLWLGRPCIMSVSFRTDESGLTVWLHTWATSGLSDPINFHLTEDPVNNNSKTNFDRHQSARIFS